MEDTVPPPRACRDAALSQQMEPPSAPRPPANVNARARGIPGAAGASPSWALSVRALEPEGSWEEGGVPRQELRTHTKPPPRSSIHCRPGPAVQEGAPGRPKALSEAAARRPGPQDAAPCLQQGPHHRSTEAGAGQRASMAWWQEHGAGVSQDELKAHCPSRSGGGTVFPARDRASPSAAGCAEDQMS